MMKHFGKSSASDIAASASSQSTYAPLSLADMPDREVLIRFADGTLRGKRKRAIQQLANSDLAVLRAVAYYVRLYAPIRHLSSRWLGWKGAILYALGRLPESIAREWEAHCERCRRSRVRTQLARALLAPARWSAPQSSASPRLLRFAFSLSGWIVAVGLGGYLFMSGGVSSRFDGASDPAPVSPVQSKGTSPVVSSTDDPVLLDFAPDLDNPEILHSKIERFEWLIQQDSTIPEFHSRLAFYYEQLAQLTPDAESKRQLLDKAAQSRAKAEQLWNAQRPNSSN
ncbi:MAG: hypothetical protein NZM10_04320 [Fimbriimonadales bacterium]|nr:hypothetical protein [Fimbriimonadales bacterium]